MDTGLGIGLTAIGAGLAVGLAAIATGLAQARIGAAGAGVIAEKPEALGTIILLVAIPETGTADEPLGGFLPRICPGFFC